MCLLADILDGGFLSDDIPLDPESSFGLCGVMEGFEVCFV